MDEKMIFFFMVVIYFGLIRQSIVKCFKKIRERFCPVGFARLDERHERKVRGAGDGGACVHRLLVLVGVYGW